MDAPFQPEYPALLVHEDGSIYVLPEDADWMADLRLSYWSDPQEYIVDCHGLRFDQVVNQVNQGNPEQNTFWQLNRRLSLAELKQLCREHFLVEKRNLNQMMEPLEKISGDDAPRKIIEYLLSIQRSETASSNSGFRPTTWWQYGLFGSLILFLMTGWNFLKAIPDFIQGNAAWGELPLFAVQIVGIGFVCGLAVWAVQPLWRNYGTLGDVLSGIIVLDVMFVCCMVIFDPDMLLGRTEGAAFMFLFGSFAGAFGGYIMGKDVRKDTAVSQADEDDANNPFRK
jgi:hypothetical protein